jgi:hypothetical protein
MPIDKLIPRYLNKDDDYLIVKSVEMVDALNIQTSDDEGGNAGVLKNALGNVLVATGTSGDVLPSGTNTVIGSTSCKQTGEIFYFVHNSSNNHSIYQYTSIRNTVKLVYRDSALNFTATGFVKADCIVKENGETLLYFTDGITDPKKINATRALANTSGVSGYPYRANTGGAYTTDEKLLSITTIKAPPTTPLSVAVSSVTGVTGSNIKNKSFQFAYQYIYEDGELSAISSYSEIATNYMSFLDGYVTDDMKNFFNAVVITYAYSKADVSKIRLLCREGNLNNFFIIKEVDNNRDGTTGSFTFTNDTIGTVISDNEINKQYDSVPLSARSQVISGNRLSFGGYTEFYDNTNVSGSVEFSHDAFSPKVISVSSTSAYSSYIVSGAGQYPVFNLNISDFPPASDSPVVINLRFTVLASEITITSGATITVPTHVTSATGFGTAISSSGVANFKLGETKFDINKSVIVSSYTSLNELGSGIINAITGTTYSASVSPTVPSYSVTKTDYTRTYYYSGNLSLNVSGSSIDASGNIIFNIAPVSGGLNIETSEIMDKYLPVASRPAYSVVTQVPALTWNNKTLDGVVYDYAWTAGSTTSPPVDTKGSFGLQTNSYSCFKSGQRHKFGIVYYDQYNRSSAVNEIGEYYNQNEGERTNQGKSSAILRINSNPPSWAKKWQLVYSPYTSYNFAYRYSVAEAFLGAQTSGSSTNRRIYLSMRHLEGNDNAYKEAKGALFNYSYAQGDKLRVVSYTDPNTSGTISYPSQYIFNIVGYEYIDTTGTINVAVTGGGTAVTEYRSKGWFLIVEDQPGYFGFSAVSVSGGTNNWDNDAVIEIYRPVIPTASPVYKEISEVYDVSGGLHNGDRNQNAVVSGTLNATGSTFIGTASGSAANLFVGDELELTNADPGTPESPFYATIGTISFNANGFPIITFSSFSGSAPATTSQYSYSLVSGTAIVKSSNGDCYYRPRQIKLNPFASGTFAPSVFDVSGIRYVDYFVEDLSISDFYTSNYINIGRPNVAAPNAKQIDRKSSITYSEPYSLDTSVLKLSSFNGGQGNFVDLPNRYGAIEYMIDNGDSITVLQEVKCSIIPINRNTIQYADGNTNIAVSTNYLGTENVYAGDYGTQNPESVKSYGGRVYFADVRAGKIVRIGGDGIELISEAKVDAYTQDKCFIISSTSGTYKVIGGADPQHGEYLVTYVNVSGGNSSIRDTIAYDMDDKVWNTRYSFIPEAYELMDNYMYTFASGSMYRHTDAADRNSYYGSYTNSIISVISALNNSMVKAINAISVEGSVAPYLTLVSSTTQSTRNIGSSEYSLREGNYYVDVPRNQSSSSTANYHAIGVVSATGVTGGNLRLTFSSSINNMQFQSSGTTFITVTTGGVTGSTTYTSATRISDTVLELNGSGTAISVGVIFVNVSNASVDGDQMRSSYFLIKMDFDESTPIEIYSINTHFAESKLHNNLGQ